MGRQADRDLTSAVIHGDANAVVVALARGADPNAQIAGDGTLLHLAVIAGCLETVEQLINSGARLNARDGRGWTPLHFAGFANDDPKLIDRLLAAGADINVRDRNGMTPLDCASAMGISATAQALLKAGGTCDGRSLEWVRRIMPEGPPGRDQDRG